MTTKRTSRLTSDLRDTTPVKGGEPLGMSPSSTGSVSGIHVGDGVLMQCGGEPPKATGGAWWPPH
jgi:hypothetical protein